MRGKRGVFSWYASGRWITPARAGKTPSWIWTWRTMRDHPRACGENRLAVNTPGGRLGSPPRVRGKPVRHADSRGVARITPARAGKTPSSTSPFTAPRDHPRACGENHSPAAAQSSAGGSPPRVRGKPIRHADSRGTARITPARAGKTALVRLRTEAIGDHPRACGENGRTM